MRILHVTPYFEDAWAYGGIPRVVAALAKGLAARGHAVTVCTTDASSENARLSRPAGTGRFDPWQDASAPGIDVRVFPNISNTLAYDFQGFLPIGLSAWLTANARDFDIAHLHACHNVPGVIAARHLAHAGVPYVLAPNGTAPRIERRRFAKRLFDTTVGRHVLRDAARVLAVSNAERSDLVSLGVPAHRIVDVPNPINLSEFDAPVKHGEFRRAFGLGHAPLVTFLGKMTPRKRLDTLAQAFALLGRRDARLVLAGNDMGVRSQLEREISALGIASQTLFTGTLTGRARLHALADASLVVYAGDHEAFGLVPFEALLCGTPLIVGDDSGCGENIRRVRGGLTVPPGDAAALASVIERVLDSQDRWRKAAVEAQPRIRASFGTDTICERLEETYAEVRRGRTTLMERPVLQTGRPNAVSVVIPVHNGARWIARVLDAVADQDYPGSVEIIVVDDGSSDRSPDIVRDWAAGAAGLKNRPLPRDLGVPERPVLQTGRTIRCLTLDKGRGAAAAINRGIRAASYELIAQIDHDVVIHQGWLSRLVDAMADPAVAAAQGHYVAAPDAGIWPRVMGLDLRLRYRELGLRTNHVCTGNTIYRKSALQAIGLFDETMGYGYDNDVSYRLSAAGYEMAFVADATSTHYWREGLRHYARQQYGFGYGRLDLVARHRSRLGGDDVSRGPMMLHGPVMAAAIVAGAASLTLAIAGQPWQVPALLAVLLVLQLGLERFVTGAHAALVLGDRAGWWFAPAHLVRDVAWAAAIFSWTTRRLLGARAEPQHSMRARQPQG